MFTYISSHMTTQLPFVYISPLHLVYTAPFFLPPPSYKSPHSHSYPSHLHIHSPYSTSHNHQAQLLGVAAAPSYNFLTLMHTILLHPSFVLCSLTFTHSFSHSSLMLFLLLLPLLHLSHFSIPQQPLSNLPLLSAASASLSAWPLCSAALPLCCPPHCISALGGPCLAAFSLLPLPLQSNFGQL